MTHSELQEIAEDLVILREDIVNSSDFSDEEKQCIRQMRLDFLANNKVLCPWTNKIRDPEKLKRVNVLFHGNEKELLSCLYGDDWQLITSYGDYWGEQCIVWKEPWDIRINPEDVYPYKDSIDDDSVCLNENFQKICAHNKFFMPIPDNTKIHLGKLSFVPQNEFNLILIKESVKGFLINPRDFFINSDSFIIHDNYYYKKNGSFRYVPHLSFITFVVEQIDSDYYAVFAAFRTDDYAYGLLRPIGHFTVFEFTSLVETYVDFIKFQKF